jgi:hypothetical protein
MNTCKVIVKHGVSLVTGASTSNSNSSSSSSSHGNMGTMANAHRLAPLCSSSTSSSSSQAEFFSVRALAHSFPHLCARQAPSQQLQQWRSFGQSQALQYNSLGGPFLVSFKRSVRNGDGSTTIVASSQNGGEKDVAVVALRQEEDGGPKFDVSSNCVTPVFRFSPFIQQPSVCLSVCLSVSPSHFSSLCFSPKIGFQDLWFPNHIGYAMCKNKLASRSHNRKAYRVAI